MLEKKIYFVIDLEKLFPVLITLYPTVNMIINTLKSNKDYG